MRAVRPAVTIACLLSACSSGYGPLMSPGQDCLRCHDGETARRWTVAGTWEAGAHVTVTDAVGRSLTLRGNEVGNFYSAEQVTLPLTLTVDGRTMPMPAAYGGCNQCHGPGGAITGGLVTGPLMRPGEDCLACHDGAQATRFTVAGTWGAAAGRTVTLVDARGQTLSLTTNAVGNFYTAASLAFPLVARVGASTMPDPVTSGGCNGCHGPGGSAN